MKKFLSLVLALVMTMSLVTVSAGAKDFSDSTKIQYKEAVDVMSAVNVISGYAEGDFRPTATLTRGAAAKIICNLILGPTTASALVADAAPYKDVPTNHTFAGYIAYCQKTGIISGYADGTFKPANSLTGYAFMKMLLGALGYKADVEGYTSPNWSINVAKQAINAGLNPVKDSLLIEGSASAYANILAVKEGTENTDAVKALKAALESQQVVDYINQKYDGSVVSVVTNPTDGYDASVNYDALNGTTISIAASPTPHAEILEVAKQILAAKGVTLDIQVYNDYVVPNTVVDDGTVTANYFQHLPYLEDFNAQNNTHIVSVGGIHVEPMGLYGGKQTTLDAISGK